VQTPMLPRHEGRQCMAPLQAPLRSERTDEPNRGGPSTLVSRASAGRSTPVAGTQQGEHAGEPAAARRARR
jgi:hypothetical protein